MRSGCLPVRVSWYSVKSVRRNWRAQALSRSSKAPRMLPSLSKRAAPNLAGVS